MTSIGAAMYDTSYVKKAGQFWKLGVLMASSILGVALMWLGQSQLEDPASSDLMLILAGVAIVFGGGAWASWAVECPTCKDKLLWHAVTRQSSGFWLHWLIGLASCPYCQATVDKKSASWSVTSSQS
jgi:endogenous inhibitor of DNA gyrase (YacG/DUF329 family)